MLSFVTTTSWLSLVTFGETLSNLRGHFLRYHVLVNVSAVIHRAMFLDDKV